MRGSKLFLGGTFMSSKKKVDEIIKKALIIILLSTVIFVSGCSIDQAGNKTAYAQSTTGIETVSAKSEKTSESMEDDNKNEKKQKQVVETDDAVSGKTETDQTPASEKETDIDKEISKPDNAYFNLQKTYPISEAKYLTEDMIIDRAREILDFAAKNKYVYGDSQTTPPCTDKKISCDRLIASMLWSYGFTDQPKGGIVVKDESNEDHDMSSYLKKHGFTESIGMDEVKRGSILIVTDMRGHWKGHAFILGEMEGEEVSIPDGENVKRYDAGDVWAAASSNGDYPDEPVLGWPYPKDETVFVYNLPEITESDLEGVYNYDYYIAHYPAVRAITGGARKETLEFFFQYGINAGHQGCETFNVWDYIENQPDLKEIYGHDLRSYYYNYLGI